MTERTKKIAIVGAEGYDRRSDEYLVDCYSWSQVSRLENIQDYDLVIIDLLTAPDPKSTSYVDFHRLMNRTTVFTLLNSEGRIIVLGDPRFTYFLSDDPNRQESADFLEWSCVKFDWDEKPGDTVIISEDITHSDYVSYLKNLKKWKYSLRKCSLDMDAISEIFNVADARAREFVFIAETDVFCRNRVGNALAFSVQLYVGEKQWEPPFDTHRVRIIKKNGPITFLPEIGLDHDQMIMLVLRDVCGIDSGIPEPSWLIEFEAPGQQDIDGEIDDIKSRISSMLNDLDEAVKRRNEARLCLGLLYERGDALEKTVRHILSELGGNVEAPQDPGKEDGWVEVNAKGEQLEMVLEIKSTKNDQFGEDGFKQLLEWRSRGATLRDKEYKGVFIGSSCVNKTPQERPFAFSDSAMKMAKLHGLAAIKTEDLYVVHILNKAGRIDTEAFWHSLFHTDGVFDINAIVEQTDSRQD